MVEDLVAAAEHARDVGADLHVVLACGFGAEHGVVAEDVAYVEFEEVEALGDLGDYGIGDIADLVLRVEQHRDECRALERIYGGEMVEALGQGWREDRIGYWAHCISSRV